MYKIIGGDQQEYGPVSAEEIRHWVAEGRANAQTLVQMIGDNAWRPLGSYPEFADVSGAIPLASPPPFPNPHAPAAGPALTSAEILARDYEVDISRCVSRGWQLLQNKFWPIVGVSFLVLVVLAVVSRIIGFIDEGPMDALIHQHEITPGGGLLIGLSTLLDTPVEFILIGGLFNFYLKLIRGKDSGVEDAFTGFTQAPVRLILLGLTVGLLTLLGVALCIVPGIYLSVAWIFAVPLVIDKKTGVWEAMEFSRKVVNRHWFMVFALVIIVGLIKLCGFLACCIGIIVSSPLGWVIMMYAYEDIFSRRNS